MQIPQEGWGISFYSFNWNWKRDHILCALPGAGEGCGDRTPVLVTTVATYHIEFTSLKSLDGCIQVSCSCAALQCQSDLSMTDLSIQKRAVLMYSVEKLLFYDLFIKSLIENWFLSCGCPLQQSDKVLGEQGLG